MYKKMAKKKKKFTPLRKCLNSQYVFSLVRTDTQSYFDH